MDKVIIIAEAGVNHNGDINLAFQLVDKAAEAGVDYIKFQTFITEFIVAKDAPKAEYQKLDSENETQYEMIKKLELPFDDFIKIKEYCTFKGLKFLTSVGDFTSLKRIDALDLDYIKISSGEITNLLFLREIASKKKPVILSTGMADITEIGEALAMLIENGLSHEDIFILHCNTEYPTPYHDVNLNAMLTIKDAFKVEIGYSDHTLGLEVPIAAVALGAKVIEKHFTLDKQMEGPDHSSSLDPQELKDMVTSIRNIELAISGNGRKEPSPSEAKNKVIVRKSLFARQSIKEGDALSLENIILKRPGDGIPAKDLLKILGKKASRDISIGEKLTEKDILW